MAPELLLSALNRYFTDHFLVSAYSDRSVVCVRVYADDNFPYLAQVLRQRTGQSSRLQAENLREKHFRLCMHVTRRGQGTFD